MNIVAQIAKLLTEDIPAAAFMFKRARKPFVQYEGNVHLIAHTIINDCFNGKFFQVSLGHFPQFYMRDFGMCVNSLCELGYTKKCHQTVLYALTHYMRSNRVSTTIDHKERCVDFFAYGPDSLAFLLHAIKTTKYSLNKAEKLFLEKQAKLCKKRVWDDAYDGVKKNTYFSSAKDHYKRNASCYDFCMCAWIDSQLRKLELETPWNINFETRLIELYWSGEAFFDDLDKTEFSGDAQTFPFYCGILSKKTHKTYLVSSIKKIHELELDVPFPLKYTNIQNKKKELRIPSFFAPNYEGDAVWVHTGLCYMEVVADFNEKLSKKYVTQYTHHLEKHKTFLEVFNRDGEPYTSYWYKCDEGMLWVSMYYALYRLYDDMN